MIGTRRMIDVAEFAGVFAYFALAFAELGSFDRVVSTDSLSTYAMPATMWGARKAYDHRRSGRFIMLMWGAAAAVGLVVLFDGLVLVTRAIEPSVRAQEWMPPVLIGVAVTVILVAVVRRIRRESRVEGRKIALVETFGLGLVPVGLWLASQGETLFGLGAILAIAGPLIPLWMLAERRKRWPAADSGGAQP